MHVTLEEMLLARDARAKIQNDLLNKHGCPLISFTMNVAGPRKTSPKIERAFRVGVELIDKALVGKKVEYRREEHNKCGPVSFFSVNIDAKELKDKLVEIEDTHPLGRLFDMDVIDVCGAHLSRKQERGCIVCGAPGRACAAGRLHPLEEITSATEKIINDYFLAFDSKRVAHLAKEALIAEVYTSPKPGLVDPESRGSHKDMNVCHFVRSAEALEPYFEQFIACGAEFAKKSPQDVFPALKKIGIDAERAMYAATDNKNTHKGAIFSFGIILGAIGRLMAVGDGIPTPKEILKEAKEISKSAVEEALATADGSTAGARAYLNHGERGARGEAADGFPTVKSFGLPIYREALDNGKNKNDAGAITLLHLIKEIFDTSLYKRGGAAGVEYAREQVTRLLRSGEPSTERIRTLDRAFTKRNLSPGGAADLLAITYFLYELEESRKTTPSSRD